MITFWFINYIAKKWEEMQLKRKQKRCSHPEWKSDGLPPDCIRMEKGKPESWQALIDFGFAYNFKTQVWQKIPMVCTKCNKPAW